jgi:outer membrane protein assembly factor BamB
VKLPAALAAVLFALAASSCGAGPLGGDGDEATWAFGPQMPHRRSYPASALIDGKIYVATGMVGETGKPLDFNESFDPTRNAWTSLPPAPAKFSAASGAAYEGRLWVIGGNSPEATGRQVYSYDPQSRRWQRETPLPAIRTNLAAVNFRGKLYAIGGLAPFNPTRTVFVYDSGSKRWTEAAPLPVALQAHSAVVYRDEIWVLGGRVESLERQTRVWIYNAEQNRWRAGPPLPEPMDTLGTSVNGDRIDAVVDEEYFIYDGKKWKAGPTMQVPRHALAVYTIDDTLYAVGGCLHPQLRDSTVAEKIPAPA